MRPSKDETFIMIALELSRQSTCVRREVGCVLVNDKYHILGEGWNGVARHLQHCLDNPCTGALSPSGIDLHLCRAIHAETNALLKCKDIYSISTAYVTTSPCDKCLDLLLNTSCQRIVFLDEYPSHDNVKQTWLATGREWIKLEILTT